MGAGYDHAEYYSLDEISSDAVTMNYKKLTIIGPFWWGEGWDIILIRGVTSLTMATITN